ncbi:hypothetical protein BDD21_2641 [Thiocapsa rosea]|uniref:Uncharacterized protein n=1 Tax=Thiocapsa rosea TaxID=69360 RepID=A0A495V759_9GAMM|nr:hypothetical protein BDD21_2641 [Thiocapsa rosea]
MNLTVPIPDRAATALAGLARARGQTPEHVIATLVEQRPQRFNDPTRASANCAMLLGSR